MRKSYKKKFFTAILILIVVISLSSCLFGLNSYDAKITQALKYLEDRYAHNENIVYISTDYIFVNGEKYDPVLALGCYYYKPVAKIENQLLYYFDAVNFNKNYETTQETHLTFYKGGYDLSNLVCVKQIPLTDILYHQKETVIYTSSDETVVLYNAIEDFESEYSGQIPSITSKYSWRDDRMAFSENKLFITDLKTGQEIQLNDYESNLLKLESAQYLKETFDLKFYSVITTEEKLYVQCISTITLFTSIISTYEFDFATGEFIFVDWVANLDPDGCDTYFLKQKL